MTMMMTRVQRFLKSRQLHTIISQETIKPSSLTPPHLKTHNLTVVDQLATSINIPFTLFYKNYKRGDINTLKKSLSQTLTSYYPFAGRILATPMPHVDCNDEGVKFIEASNDGKLSDFIHKKELDETIEELIPNYALQNNPNMVEIQLTHLSCGGAAVTVSVSHKVADGFTVSKFINHWASVTRGGSGSGSPKKPTFFSSKTSVKLPELDFQGSDKSKYVTRRFVFPDAKLNELKNKVKASVNPTRVELLSALIFKCAVNGATMLSGSLQPSNMYQVLNMRDNIIKEKRPEIAAGNIIALGVVNMPDLSEIKLNEVIEKFRKDKTEINSIQVSDVEELGELFLNRLSSFGDERIRRCGISSLCRLPFYETDFGWGKPVQVIFKNTYLNCTMFHFMDAPSGEGIEVMATLKEEEMTIFQKDKEIVAYSDN